jgi:3-hydroxyisobutyrate dehydrogenase-like beta-hydroxyacid dehydrogenase
VRPLFDCMGQKIIHVGEVGHGHALKAINNFLSAASMYATTEAMIIAESVGLDLNTCLETINGSSGQSYSTHYKFPKFVLPRSFNSEFSLDLLLKDLKMAVSLARDNEVPLFLGATLEQVYESAQQVLGKGCDHTEIVQFLEKTSGRTLKHSEV